ncbi:unnamed protein product [Mytilus coruscus]|uniref:Fibronectin type-III domain-containing protein n=1 Tax=Mytilus coruscus TaxID=42192 RepID=A0A6J8DNS4_MYTCO|nr:unnamed protein product [Mytilus coruscus]
MHNTFKEIVLITGLFYFYCIFPASGFCGTDPSGIKVTTKSAKSIHVSWDTTKTNCGYIITGYRVYFNSLSPFKTYKKKDVSGATTDNVEIFPIVPGFSYNIFVKALTANGEVSNPTSINYTHPHTKPGAPPSNIHVFKKDITSLTIAWNALDLFSKNGDVKGYQVYYRGPGLSGTKSVNVLGEANTQYTLTGLRPNSTYQFILRVINDVGGGPFSSFVPFSTLPLQPEKDTNNILLMVGIAAGALIFLAVLIPLVVFMCRNCCLKGAVSPDQEEEEDKNKFTKKEAFRPLDENENKTVTKYDRRMSTDTLLSIDKYDIDEVNDTSKMKSRHRRLSKRALSYTDDNIAEDAKQIQNNLQVDKFPLMRVESIQEVKEPDHRDDNVFIDDNEIRQAKSDGGANSLTDKPKVTSNIYVLNANIQTKIFTSKKSRISPNFENDFSFMHDAIKDESSLHDPSVRSATAFNVITKPAQITPRAVLFEPV